MSDPALTEEQNERLERILADYMMDLDKGQAPSPQELFQMAPDLAAEIAAFLEDQTCFQNVTVPLNGLSRLSGVTRPGDMNRGHPLPAGTMVGSYRLERLIGHGGMGSVYLARHETLQREVALKLLAPALARDARFVQRFQREAQTLARLRHPNIVSIHDLGQQGELFFLVMEHVDGVNLRELVAREPLSAAEALKLAPQLCAALEYAHEQGIVHRDIKPENILIGPNGTPKIADFGLARIIHGDDTGESLNLTQTHMLLGTRNYMAPEQWHTAKVDHRADIYAVGVILYELLTGKLPIGHFDPPSRSKGLTTDVDHIVLRALEQEPDERYQKAGEMGSEITNLLSKGPLGARISELVLIDLASGRPLGRAAGNVLRVEYRDDELIRIQGWDRPEVGYNSENAEKGLAKITPFGVGRTSGSTSGLHLNVTGDESVFYVPDGVILELQCPEATVSIENAAGDVTVWTGSGNVRLANFRGRLRIERSEHGNIEIAGLHSDDVQLRTQYGSMAVRAFSMTRGQCHAQSLDGGVRFQLAPDASVEYELVSVDGTARVSEYVAPPTGEQVRHLTGSVGSGKGQLRLSSSGGNVLLTDYRTKTFAGDGSWWWHLLWWALIGWGLFKLFS